MFPKKESDRSLAKSKLKKWLPVNPDNLNRKKTVRERKVNDYSDDDLVLQNFSMPCAVPRWLNRIEKDSVCIPPKKVKHREYTFDELEESMQRMYDIVVGSLGGNEFILLSNDFNDNQKSLVIKTLKSEGFKVKKDDFDEVIDVVRTVKDKPAELIDHVFSTDRSFEHASLNCYDYKQLKVEMEKLKNEIGIPNIQEFCPTLTEIYVEAIKGEKEEYRGRHLPFNKLHGRKHQVYVELRMLDEILCTSDSPLTLEGINRALGAMSKKYGIQQAPYLSAESLRKRTSVLSRLINVEHTWGQNDRYFKGVFEPGKCGYLYKHVMGGLLFDDGSNYRLSAFTVDISLHEAYRLRKEIKSLQAEFYLLNQDEFAYKYPLLVGLGHMSSDKMTDVNEIPESNLVTVNYKSEEERELKKKVEAWILLKKPVSVVIDSEKVDLIPQKIIKSRGKWSLEARKVRSSDLCVVPPDTLADAFEYDSSDPFEPAAPAGYIGVSRFVIPQAVDITLELTKKGVEDISRERSAFNAIDFSVQERRIAPYEKYNRGSLVSFKLYVNNDFFEELYRLDCAAKLISIEPVEVNDRYLEFFKQRHGSERIPLMERPQSLKRLKKRNLNE